MNTDLHLKKKILLFICLLLASFTVFSQNQYTPYNIVMNIYGNPKTTMAFNWFTGTGITGGQVKIMLGGVVVNTVTTNKEPFSFI
jgi:hypothetical protein